jgi:hypothetical protein
LREPTPATGESVVALALYYRSGTMPQVSERHVHWVSVTMVVDEVFLVLAGAGR